MTSAVELQAVKEMALQCTLVQIIDGDGALIARTKNQPFLLQRSLMVITLSKKL